MTRNKVKAKLKKGEPITVPEISHIFSPKIVEIMGKLGYERVWIDMEHSVLGYERLAELAMAARISGMDVIVRIAKGGYTSVIKPLEAGANALVLPHCMNKEEAQEFVRMAKFAPLGLRGIGCGVDSDYGAANLTDYLKEANAETLLIAQIEDKEAVENIEGIAATEGIDVLFIGPADLSQSYGLPGRSEHPVVQKAIDTVAAACKKNKKTWGIRVFSEEQTENMLKRGAQFFSVVSEVEILRDGFKNSLEKYKKVFKP